MLVFSELIERARRDEIIEAAIIPMKKHWRQMLVDILSEGVSDGVFRADLDPEPFANVLIGTFIGFCRSPHKDPASFERLIAELQRAIRNPAIEPDANLSNGKRVKRHSTTKSLKE